MKTVANEKQYDVLLVPQPEGGFTVYVPDLPDVVTEGETREEALAMATDAIEGYLETMADHVWGVRAANHERVVQGRPDSLPDRF
jgi:antitoxin HicB